MSSIQRYLISFCAGMTIVAIATIVERTGDRDAISTSTGDLALRDSGDTTADLVAGATIEPVRDLDGNRRIAAGTVRPQARIDRKKIVDAKIAAATTEHDRAFESAVFAPTRRTSGNAAFAARARALGLRGADATRLREWMRWKEAVETDALTRGKDYPPRERARLFNAASSRIRQDLALRFGAGKAQQISTRVPLRSMDDQGEIHRTDAKGGRMQQADHAKDDCDA